MASLYHINPSSDVPIYQQLVDEIRSAIKMERLKLGEQLPTVLQMANDTGIARGTVQRAYDELNRMGLIEKVQGRGTFVCYQPLGDDGRKEQAMAAIDSMLDRMGELGFPMAEVQLFLDLKLRERESRLSNVKVAVIECNQENLSQMSEQLRGIEGVDLYSYLLSYVQAYPYNLGEEMDLIVTTAEHAAYLQSILPEQKKIARVALRLSPASMAQIVKLQAGETVGVLGCSQRFADLLYEACGMYTEQVHVEQPRVISNDLQWEDFLNWKSAVLVPDGFEKYTNAEGITQLQNFARRRKLIRCAYEMDEGSFLYLQERIGRLREEKAI